LTIDDFHPSLLLTNLSLSIPAFAVNATPINVMISHEIT